MGTGGFVATGGGRVEMGGGGIGAPPRFAGEGVTKARSFRFDGFAGAIGLMGVGVAS